MKKLLLMVAALLSPLWISAQSLPERAPESSACHVFLDDQNIWTLETLAEPDGTTTPIMNIITFSPGTWDFRPRDVHLYNRDNREAIVEKFSMDTGVPGEPYLMEYLSVKGNGFIGLDLLGSFENFVEPTRVVIDLEEDRFQLEPLDCLDFNALAEKIDRVNFDSPNIWEDYEVLQIEFRGDKSLRPQDP
ncbi:MAG: hypothetical protein V3R94_04580 [Acidobacteriota bacterium]